MDFQGIRPTRRSLLAIGVAAGLVAAPLSAPLAATAATSIDGIWQTDGYGTVVAIDNGSARLYSTTRISCTPAGEFVRDGSRFTAEGEQAFTVRPSTRADAHPGLHRRAQHAEPDARPDPDQGPDQWSPKLRGLIVDLRLNAGGSDASSTTSTWGEKAGH